MKTNKLLLYFIFAFILFSSSCSKKTIPFASASAEVNFLSENDGTITMRALGIGANESEAFTNAVFNAFDILFFRGLPESQQKNPLVGTNESEERLKNKDYFDNFYRSRFQTFVMSQIPTSEIISLNNGQKSIAIDIKINLTALRKDLEQNNIIRKFGF